MAFKLCSSSLAQVNNGRQKQHKDKKARIYDAIYAIPCFLFSPENELKHGFLPLFTAGGHLIQLISQFFPGSFDKAGRFTNTSQNKNPAQQPGCCSAATDVWQDSTCLDTDGIEFMQSKTVNQFLAARHWASQVEQNKR